MIKKRKALPLILWSLGIIGFISYYPFLLLPRETFYQIGKTIYITGNHGCYHTGLRSSRFFLKGAVNLGSTRRDAFDKLSSCYQLLGKPDKAEQTYTKALEYFPKDVEFYFCRGEIRKDLRDFKGALGDYNQTILLGNNSEYAESAFYGRGAMKYLLGDIMGANKDRTKAQKLAGYEFRTYADYCQLFQ